ncbi:MAG TPA: hypothetical protein VIL48_09705 [Acidimicrobiales bacterium]
MSKGTLWGMIDAQPVYFPAVVNEMNAASLVFSVPTERARTVVPEDAFDLVESAPGTAPLVMAAHHYIQGGWGEGRTFDFGFRVRPAGAPDEPTGLLLHPSPMSPTFNREAAYRALGFPKTSGEVEVTYTDDTVTFTLAGDPEPEIMLRLPRARSDVAPAPVGIVAYTCVAGETKLAPFELNTPIGIVDPGDVVLELGSGPLAGTLRLLGLPRAPDLALWGEGASAVFHAPRPAGGSGD